MLEIIASFLLIVSAIYYFYFSLIEGRDERGKAILYLTNSICMGIILISLGVFQLIYRITDIEFSNYVNLNFLVISAAFTINAIMILILRRS